MVLNTATPQRLLVFFFYDKDGVVDRYISVLLDGLKDFFGEIMVISNGSLAPGGRAIFERFTTNIIERENVGFDVWAYKTGLDYYGWERLEEFDEVVLMNYTIFGPLYPFEDMFAQMGKRDLDFWGITKHHKVDFDCFGTCKYKYIPEHIQSNFIALRKSIISSKLYQDLWNNMPMINSYAESVGLYEAIFTKDFTDAGFCADVYINTDDLEGYTRYPLMMMSDELIINRHCPVMKVKSFSQNYFDILGDCIGNCTVDTFEYIRTNLEYDTDLIWEHVLRTANMADIKYLVHLNYILPKKYKLCPEFCGEKKIALFMHLYFSDRINYCMSYAKHMPVGSDLIITVSDIEMKALVQSKIPLNHFSKVEIILVENRGRDVSALLIGCAQYVFEYDYVCFIHDKKTTQIEPYCIGESFAYKCFENNLASTEYIENIITTFRSNPRLGILMPPPPNHGAYSITPGSEWFNNYDLTVELAEKLGLNVNIHWSREPIAPLGTMFWFRPRALKILFDYGWDYIDFPPEPNDVDGTLLHAIERIYPFAAQQQGFYVAWGMTDEFTKVEIDNLYYLLRVQNNKNPSMKMLLKNAIKNLMKKCMPDSLFEFAKKIYHSTKRK